jgi:DNA-binding MarR family transcriptional regulator
MPDTRWLTQAEQHAWRSFLEASRLLFDALDRDLQQDAGIPHAYYEILVRLSESTGRTMRMNKLAETTRSSRSRLSHAIDRLVERGWVERLDCPTDRRGQLAELTEEGFAALAAAAPGHVAAVRSFIIDQLSADDLQALDRISGAIIDRLHPAGAADCLTDGSAA